MDNDTIKVIQNKEFDLLIEFKRICDKYKIKYSLYRGTMLGAVKYKGFVPWDDDLDVVMLKHEYEKFLSVVEQELDKEKYFFQNINTDADFDIPFCNKLRINGTKLIEAPFKDKNIHQGIWMDIFVLYDFDGDLQKLNTFRHNFKIWKNKYRFNSEFRNKNFKGKLVSLIYQFLPPFRIKQWVKRLYKQQYLLGGNDSEYLVELFHNNGDIFIKKDISYSWLEFCGQNFMVFSDYDNILKMLYGENYLLTEPQIKTSHHKFIEVSLT